MIHIHKLGIYFIISLFISCTWNGEKEAVTIRGIVIDKGTNRPVPNANVTVLFWRYVNSGEETYDKVDTVSSKDGRFEVSGRKGIKVDAGAFARGYSPVRVKNIDLKEPLTLLLDKSAPTKTRPLGKLVAFVRKITEEPKTTGINFGLDLIGGRSTSSRDSMDLVVMVIGNERYPRRIIMNDKASIVPIFTDSDSEIELAPTGGYVREYVIKGTETGFFVKCRDGVHRARLMLSSLEYHRTMPYDRRVAEDHGVVFDVLLRQGAGKFTVPSPERLEYYILDPL